MKTFIVNEKALRKRMIDLDIRSINDLAAGAGVSRPTIYEFLNGKSPMSSSFTKLCNYLKTDPLTLLVEVSLCDKERDSSL